MKRMILAVLLLTGCTSHPPDAPDVDNIDRLRENADRLEAVADRLEEPIVIIVVVEPTRSESQRAMIAAEIANLKRGGDRGNQHTGGKGSIGPLPDPTPVVTQSEAANMMNVSP